MELNKVSADFYFVGIVIKKLNIDNSIIILSDSIEKKMSFDVINIDSKETENGFLGTAQIGVVVELWDDKEKVSSFQIELEGCFGSPLSIGDKRFKELLALNGVAALYSICRAKVETISAAMLFDGKIVLPFISVPDYYKELNDKKESQK